MEPSWLGIGASTWATFLAVVVALGIGVTSILHTNSLQKKERKERLLNEIIEWAVDIVKCALEQHFEISTIESDMVNKDNNS